VCENGLVHYCSQQRGYPAVPLELYTVEDLRREFANPKACAPFCTVGCVHRVSIVDAWRSPQRETPVPHADRTLPRGPEPLSTPRAAAGRLVPVRVATAQDL
jgi:hypothetical protein